ASSVPWPIFDKLLYSKEGQRSKVGRFLGAVCHLAYVKRRHQPAENKASPVKVAFERIRDAVAMTMLDSCCIPPLLRLVHQGSSSALQRESSSCGACICDAVAVAIALKPEAVRKSSNVHVEVELKGEITRGQTVVDWGTCHDGAQRPRRVCWAEEVDVAMFCQLLRETVAA
ncbi:unnamed protein product, partial [Polarella glacialis]